MWQRECRRSGEGRKKQRLIQLLHESSAASPDSGLLSNWSKNKGFFEPPSNWLVGWKTRSAECGVRSVENAEYGKCGVWRMRSMENAECGKCGVWKMRSVENAEYGKCGVCGNA